MRWKLHVVLKEQCWDYHGCFEGYSLESGIVGVGTKQSSKLSSESLASIS